MCRGWGGGRGLNELTDRLGRKAVGLGAGEGLHMYIVST